MTPSPQPLRVGLVSAYDLDVPGGVQAQVLGLAGELRHLGYEVGVMAPGPSVAVAAGPPSVSAGRAVPVAANGSVARLALFTSRGSVAAWSARHDVVHLHEPLALGLPQAVLRSSACPVVATVHASTDSAVLRLAAPLLRRRMRRAAVLTAVSDHALATLRHHLGLDAVVVGNGLDVPARLPSAPPPAAGAATVLAVGRLAEPRKGIDVLLSAWPVIRGRHPAARLVLVGPGRPRGLAAGAPLPAGVQVLGRVDDVTRTQLLDAATLVVAPHRGGESFGLVVAEAMARGRCVVASALPAFVDLLGPGDGGGPVEGGAEAGVTVVPGDPAALAAAVTAALDDEERRRVLGAAAWRRIGGHAWPVVTEQYLQAYRHALDGADAPGPPRLLP